MYTLNVKFPITCSLAFSWRSVSAAVLVRISCLLAPYSVSSVSGPALSLPLAAAAGCISHSLL